MSLKDKVKIEEATVTHIETLKNFWLDLVKRCLKLKYILYHQLRIVMSGHLI